MKKMMLLLLAVLTLASCSEEKVNVRWATFNMRYDNPNDAPNHWGARKERVAQYIKEMKFDVFGTQEVLHNQFEDLKSMLPDYEGVGVGRDDGATRGEYAAIFYNKNVFDALDSGTFWLSENPDSIGKLGWDAACVRIATWAKLQHKATGKIVMAVNTHYDHVGKEARKQSSLLIIRKINENDVADLKEWLGRDEIYTYWGRKASKGEKNPELMFVDPRPWVKRKPSPDFDWGIVLKESNKVIGMIAVFGLTIQHTFSKHSFDACPDVWQNTVLGN